MSSIDKLNHPKGKKAWSDEARLRQSVRVRQRRSPHVDDNLLIELYESGLSVQRIADQVGLHRDTVQSHLKFAGVQFRQSGWNWVSDKPRQPRAPMKLEHRVAKSNLPKNPDGSLAFSEETLRDLYETQGLTRLEVAEKLGITDHQVRTAMRMYSIPARRGGSRVGVQTLDDSPSWKGDEASYAAFHQRVHKQKGMPSHCESCGLNDPDAPYHWANLTGKYEDIEDYRRMCQPCHMRYDAARRGLEGGVIEKVVKGDEHLWIQTDTHVFRMTLNLGIRGWRTHSKKMMVKKYPGEMKMLEDLNYA